MQGFDGAYCSCESSVPRACFFSLLLVEAGREVTPREETLMLLDEGTGHRRAQWSQDSWYSLPDGPYVSNSRTVADVDGKLTFLILDSRAAFAIGTQVRWLDFNE